ncbi:MAG: efflux RND transporter permease subunit [Longimicrobiales bacterium]
MSTGRPVAVAMLFLAIVLLGIISFTRLPIDLLPDVSYPRLVVYTGYPDVAPAEVERLITERVEAQAAAVHGVEGVSSVSREGVSLVTLQFAWGTDMDFAMLAVRERLDNIREQLPETAERPTILRVDPQAQPILTVSLAGGADLWQTKEIAETVFRRRLEQLEGVAQATVTGGLDREIHVEVEPGALESYGLSIDDVSRALEAANYSSSGGTVLRGRYRYPLRTLGEFQTVSEIGQVALGRQQVQGGEGEEASYRIVRLSDIGEVVDGYAEREAIARYNGAESVGLLVFKESGANTVAVAEGVEETLSLLRELYPDLTVEIASNQATFIAESINNVVQALALGGLLAFLVLFLFLRDPRYPVAVATAIPISVIGTFALMEAFGVSLNIMSLGGLALGVGMLVDNSIVVLENIFRHRELGLSVFEAAALGAEEVQGAITASTLTTISVFGPIIYVEGVAGELFGALSLAVAFSLIASLVVALTLLPTLAARFRGPGGLDQDGPETKAGPKEGVSRGLIGRVVRFVTWPIRLVLGLVSVARQLVGYWAQGAQRIVSVLFGPFLRVFDREFERFATWYHGVLTRALDRRTLVLAGAAGALVIAGLVTLLLDRDLLPSVDQGAFDVRVELPEGTSLLATAESVGALERELLADPEVEAVFSRIGRDLQSYDEGDEASGVNTAVLQVRLSESAVTERVVSRVRSVEDGFPVGALSFETGQATALGQMLGGARADIAVRIQGQDLTEAYRFAEAVQGRMAQVGAIRNVRIGSERGQPQFQVEIDRDAAARYGIQPRVIAETIERSMRGDRATEFVDFDRKIGVLVRLPEHLRYDATTLEVLRVEGVPLRELVRVRETVGPAEIRRDEQARVVTVFADVASGGLAAAIAGVEGSLADLEVPPDIRPAVGGENDEMRRSFRDLAFAFGLALLLVYMILAAQFESFVHPFTILISVPLALVGAILGLAITGQGLNTMSLIGAVILVGIVVNDAIIKIDFINQARARGSSLRDAILEAGKARLRPILMTTVTTVLGLLPMALGLGRGADLRAPLAIAVIGGLLLATALTLIVVPVVYGTVEDVRTWFRRWRSASGVPMSGPEVETT